MNTAYAYEKEPTTIKAIVSAYSSTVDQTDDTPFIMASGKHVYDGAIANNCLKFGEEVIIDRKVYTVEDRMNKRYGCEYFDIWMETREEALTWGRKDKEIIIL